MITNESKIAFLNGYMEVYIYPLLQKFIIGIFFFLLLRPFCGHKKLVNRVEKAVAIALVLWQLFEWCGW